MTVLIVDDEPTMVRLFQQRFRKEIQGGQVKLVFAESGIEALEILQQPGLEVQLILTDVSMPGMSGLTLVKKIRSLGWEMPVYLTSAYDEDSLVSEGSSPEISGFIQKPLDFERLRKLFLPRS